MNMIAAFVILGLMAFTSFVDKSEATTCRTTCNTWGQTQTCRTTCF